MEFRDFLKTALDKNPETRPSAAQLLEVSGSRLPRLAACPSALPFLWRQMTDEISHDLEADVFLIQPRSIHSSTDFPWAPPTGQLLGWERYSERSPPGLCPHGADVHMAGETRALVKMAQLGVGPRRGCCPMKGIHRRGLCVRRHTEVMREPGQNGM